MTSAICISKFPIRTRIFIDQKKTRIHGRTDEHIESESDSNSILLDSLLSIGYFKI